MDIVSFVNYGTGRDQRHAAPGDLLPHLWREGPPAVGVPREAAELRDGERAVRAVRRHVAPDARLRPQQERRRGGGRDRRARGAGQGRRRVPRLHVGARRGARARFQEAGGRLCASRGGGAAAGSGAHESPGAAAAALRVLLPRVSSARLTTNHPVVRTIACAISFTKMLTVCAAFVRNQFLSTLRTFAALRERKCERSTYLTKNT